MADRATDVLAACEEHHAYGEPRVSIASDGAEVIVLSDLHVGAGLRDDGTYAGTEKFFADQAFRRLLEHLHEGLESQRAILVLNGDVIDFLRVTDVPQGAAAFDAWEQCLRKLGVGVDRRELERISPKEHRFGLKTHDYKSVWKLSRVAEGHRGFFDALADWITRGHRLVVVKGNHDLEWYWRAVRDALRLILAERIVDVSPQPLDVAKVLEETVLPRLSFVDHALVIDGELYIEHGHRFDKYSRVVGEAVLDNGVELNIPFGSFFNRYLLNRIELSYPFLDNVRPRENLLPMLIRERFFLAIKLLFQHVPFMLRLIPKRYFRYMFGHFLSTVVVIALPIAVLTWLTWTQIGWLLPALRAQGVSTINLPATVSMFLGNAVLLVVSYVLARVVAHFQLIEPSDLARWARREFAHNASYKLMTFGHTHDPDQIVDRGRWFYNTGTWIPIVESSSAEIRHDRTYTFLRLRRSSDGALLPGRLFRWNDDARRAELAVLLRRAGEGD